MKWMVSAPAIRVRGRTADILTFPTERGEQVAVPSLALEIDHIPGVELFQIVQTAPTQLRVRLHPAADADPNRVWRTVHSELTKLLNEHGLGHVSVELATEPPVPSSAGKCRTVIPLVSSAPTIFREELLPRSIVSGLKTHESLGVNRRRSLTPRSIA
jgi:hypothetical protein